MEFTRWPNMTLSRIQGKRLTLRTIEKWYNTLINMPIAARRAIIGMEPKRADIIIGGILILLTFMDLFSLREIKVSDSGNLEGYLKDKLFGESYDESLDDDEDDAASTVVFRGKKGDMVAVYSHSL